MALTIYVAYGDQDAKLVKYCFCGHGDDDHSTHPSGVTYCSACWDDEEHGVDPWHEYTVV